jgi:hypothetical protein
MVVKLLKYFWHPIPGWTHIKCKSRCLQIFLLFLQVQRFFQKQSHARPSLARQAAAAKLEKPDPMIPTLFKPNIFKT